MRTHKTHKIQISCNLTYLYICFATLNPKINMCGQCGRIPSVAIAGSGQVTWFCKTEPNDLPRYLKPHV